MIVRADPIRSGPIVYPSIATLPFGVVGAVYLAGYLLLDWVSFIEPYAHFGITPWNPGTGLSFVLVLLFGRRTIPFLFIAPLLSDLIQIQPPLPLTIVVVSSVLIGAGYSAALIFLSRPGLRFDPKLSSMRDLVLLALVAAASAAFVAASYVAVMIAAGFLPVQGFAAASLRYWVGDMIGIMVVAPFGLVALTRRRVLRMSMETALQFAAIIGALALVFGYAREQQFQLFYVLFLPIIWMAVRTGSEGVTIGIVVTQVGLILGVIAFPGKGHDVTAYQALMLVLATTGLVAGVLVTEHRSTTAQLRQHQDSLAHLARLGSMGELAAAIAHELNQPLMAAGTYTRLVNDTIGSPNADLASVADTAKKAVLQVERAAEVVRRLRALVRLDRSSRAPYSLAQIVNETVALCQPDLDRIGADVRVVLAGDLPAVMVDILQIEQALLNLLRNSIQAIGETKHSQPTITIEASAADADFVAVAVRDSGPGFPPSLKDHPFLPFSTTKAEGLGFGLPLCKSIVEAHGGQLWLDGNSPGAVIRFTLPVAKASDHA
ncbi:MAG TPA: MASE1 domain-containing protein [Pseudolabrys sp.]|nr:MASE1 domain-containing protein [Pseudolabrys sp.]